MYIQCIQFYIPGVWRIRSRYIKTKITLIETNYILQPTYKIKGLVNFKDHSHFFISTLVNILKSKHKSKNLLLNKFSLQQIDYTTVIQTNSTCSSKKKIFLCC